MDRFIAVRMQAFRPMWADLKSNMDRFIDSFELARIYTLVYLKSNMDRFIAKAYRLEQ